MNTSYSYPKTKECRDVSLSSHHVDLTKLSRCISYHKFSYGLMYNESVSKGSIIKFVKMFQDISLPVSKNRHHHVCIRVDSQAPTLN